jgi:hypothetical protein
MCIRVGVYLSIIWDYWDDDAICCVCMHVCTLLFVLFARGNECPAPKNAFWLYSNFFVQSSRVLADRCNRIYRFKNTNGTR